MMKKNFFDRNSKPVIRRKNKLKQKLIIFAFLVLCAAFTAFIVSRTIIYVQKRNNQSGGGLYALWKTKEYPQVYAAAKKITALTPFQNTAAAFTGYSAYYLALSQTEPSAAQMYIDESIAALRIAKLYAKKNVLPEIDYMLGRSYFAKNLLYSYTYYTDLVVTYLESARQKGYKSADIPEYLGLSYATLGQTEKSIEAFTEALLIRESDTLLLAIGEQYAKNGNTVVAKQYLHRVKTTSQDDNLVLQSKKLLGFLYLEEGGLTEAQAEFNGILEKDINFADAYYGLGLIYEKQGEMVKARSEWRKALKAQAFHSGALKKLNG